MRAITYWRSQPSLREAAVLALSAAAVTAFTIALIAGAGRAATTPDTHAPAAPALASR